MRRAQKHKKSIPSHPRTKIKQAGAWFKPPHRDAAKPAPKAESDLPRKMAKVMRQMVKGRTLRGVELWGEFWLTLGKAVTKVKLSVIAWLLGRGYIIRSLVAGCWSLTGAGKAALATRNGRAVTA